jgi:hypothetical protein
MAERQGSLNPQVQDILLNLHGPLGQAPQPAAPPPPPAAPPLNTFGSQSQDNIMEMLSMLLLGDTAIDLKNQGQAEFPNVPPGSAQHLESAFRGGSTAGFMPTMDIGNLIEIAEYMTLPHGQPAGATPNKEADKAIRQDETRDILNDLLMNLVGAGAGAFAQPILGEDKTRQGLQDLTNWYYGDKKRQSPRVQDRAQFARG